MRASRGISIHTGMAFLRNEFYNMSIYRVSFWINLFYTFLMMYSVGYVWRALYAANPNVNVWSSGSGDRYGVFGNYISNNNTLVK